MDDIRKKFVDQITSVMKKKDSAFLITEEKYLEILEALKSAQEKKTKKERGEYRLLDRFSIVKVGDIEKLVAQQKSPGDPIRYVVPIEQMYDKILEKHIGTGHGGRDRLEKDLSQQFCGITRESIKIFLSLCEPCQLKRKQAKRGLVVKPILSNEMNSRCQVDLIDMQSQPDGPYRFIFVYQDHLTKFVQLRPLKTKTADDVSRKLYKIFSIFDAPHILQSDNGREFANQVVENLVKMWPECKIVHGKPRHSQSQGSVERANQDIRNMLVSWMQENRSIEWAKKGLPYVQRCKNGALHGGIKRSPYEAMFGRKMKAGLRGSSLPGEVIDQLQTEDDLEAAFSSQDDSEPEDRGESQDDVSQNITTTSPDITNPERDTSSICVICSNEVTDISTCSECQQLECLQ